MSTVRAFMSHSHDDKAIAHQLGEKLRGKGIDVWVDAWEIRPGDSIVQKIFEEGLRECKLFIVLLSPNSVRSSWVRHELDSAIVQRLSGATRVVPVVVEPCDIPVALRTLLRLDLAVESMENVVARLVDVAFDNNRKPPLGRPPTAIVHDIPGLSKTATRIATILSSSMDQSDGRPLGYEGAELAKTLDLTPDQVNDAVDELSALGLAQTMQYLGTAPFAFGHVEPTHSLAFHLRGTGMLDYDPDEDVRAVAAAIAQVKNATGETIQEITKLQPSRINHAVSYLEAYGHVDVMKFLGTAPFEFGAATATAATRRFVSNNSDK
jgi:hypothetical protein